MTCFLHPRWSSHSNLDFREIWGIPFQKATFWGHQQQVLVFVEPENDHVQAEISFFWQIQFQLHDRILIIVASEIISMQLGEDETPAPLPPEV